MEPISRRTALALGGIGLVSATVGGVGLWRELAATGPAGTAGGTFRAPEELRSADGVLDVRLEVSRGLHDVAGRQATTLGYNGGVPGPTLRVRAGDTLRIELVNRLQEATNLHVHGLHVSPEGTADNVFLSVGPGTSQQYEYVLPADHPAGTFWYHPHLHGTVADQLFGGLYGAIVVDDPTQDLPVTRERTLVVSDLTLDGSGHVVAASAPERMMGREGDLVLVNGQLRPRLDATSGERELWRVVNACASRFLDLSLAGQDVRVVGRDGARLGRDSGLDGIVLTPGNRADLVVEPTEGRSELTAHPVDRGGPMGHMMGSDLLPGDGGPVAIADLVVGPGPTADLAPVPAAPAPRDLRDTEVSGRRTLTFRMGMGGMMAGGGGFTIDGRTFDPDRVDQQVRLGTVEEWTIRNDSPMDHPFHLHVWPMQVLAVGGSPVSEPLWLDVVNVPAGGAVTVRVPFEDFGGRTVYHCHVLDHEDLGMMGTVTAR
ncbi:multicopper oxidase family protein [Isoptericola haloaureus]|uniref:Multicopper oxidase family protein n=1 Tax=Isoptericola haloaureus TaxID=1542902 RepID=A0ABU7Z2U6_9MICO